MNEPVNVVDQLKYLRKRIYFVDGLIVLVLLAAGVFVLFASLLGKHLMRALDWAGRPLSGPLASLLLISGIIAVIGICFAVWFRLRALPRFKEDELGIIFAPNFPSELEPDVERLFETLQIELKSHELANRFSVRRLPPNLTIRSGAEAGNMLAKSGAITAVWGLIDTECDDKAKTTGFSSISFTVTHVPARDTDQFRERASLPMMGKKWRFESRNVIADRQVLARDIGWVVRNMIGLSLFMHEQYGEAAKVFLPLCGELAVVTQVPGCPLQLMRFSQQVRADCAAAILRGDGKVYRRYLFGGKLNAIPVTTLQTWLGNVQEAIKLDSQNSDPLLHEAIYRFLLGDLQGAIRAAKRAKKLAPKALATPSISLAFLYNFMGDDKRSHREYQLAMAKKTSYDEDMVKQCLFFIRQCIDKYPDKKQLRLAIATIEFYRGNAEIAAEELETFIGIAKADASLSPFVSEARKMRNEARKAFTAGKN